MRKQFEGSESSDASEWQADVMRTTSRTDPSGRNKLRTYALFKWSFGFENYLQVVTPETWSRLFVQFRMGVAPLRIETGRYEKRVQGDGKRLDSVGVDVIENARCQQPQQRKLPVEERLCLCCGEGCEDRVHFLLKCPVYSMERTQLQERCPSIDIKKGEIQTFVELMASTDEKVIKAVARYLWWAFAHRQKLHLYVTGPGRQMKIDLSFFFLSLAICGVSVL